MITQPPTGLVDEALRKLRMAGQMPVALATGQAGYAIGSMPAPKPMGPPPIALNNIEAPASDRPPMSLAGNVTPEPTPGTAPSLNLRQMHDELLGKSLEVKLSRQPDTGDIQELRKTVITPGQAPAGMAENFRTNPMTSEMVKGVMLDTGRPPAMLTPSATDWTPAATFTNRMQMTKQERAADARRPIEDQMRRDQMASGERIAGEQARALAAREQIRMDTALGKAQIGADATAGKSQNQLEWEKYQADKKLEGDETKAVTSKEISQTRMQTWKDIKAADNLTLQNIHTMDNEAKANQNIITLPNGTKVVRSGQSLIYADGTGLPYYEHKSGNSMLDELILMGMSPELGAKVLQNQTNPTGEKSSATGIPQSGYADEASARAAGAKTGDIVMLNGRKARLN